MFGIHKSISFLLFVVLLSFCLAAPPASPQVEDKQTDNEAEASRVKRGGGGGYGGGGGGGGGHGHGPGKGGGAAGPVYFCGYVGKSEGYGGYGK